MSDAELIKGVVDLLKGCVTAVKEYNIERQREKTKREYVDASKQVAIRYLDNEKDKFLAFAHENFRSRNRALDILARAFDSDVARKNPAIARWVIDALVAVVTSDATGQYKPLPPPNTGKAIEI
jgi:hypothetical protein